MTTTSRWGTTGAAFAIAILSLAVAPPAGTAPTGTAFTYQGHLRQFGSTVDGTADLRFSLFDASGGGSQIGATNTLTGVDVESGVFSTEIDFGGGAFDGDERWLEIEVRHPAGGGAYTLLTPRVELLAVPYAQHSLDGAAALGAHAADASAHHIKTTDAAELTSGTLDDARLSASVSLLGPDVGTGELGFDTATQSELDLHGADPDAHHTRYTDGEATAAVAADDIYVLNTGDTVDGELVVDPNASGTALTAIGGTSSSAAVNKGIKANGYGTSLKYGGYFESGDGVSAGLSVAVSGRAFGTEDKFGGAFLAGNDTTTGPAWGISTVAESSDDEMRGGLFRAGSPVTPGDAYGIEAIAVGTGSKYGGQFLAGNAATGGLSVGSNRRRTGTSRTSPGYLSRATTLRLEPRTESSGMRSAPASRQEVPSTPAPSRPVVTQPASKRLPPAATARCAAATSAVAMPVTPRPTPTGSNPSRRERERSGVGSSSPVSHRRAAPLTGSNPWRSGRE